MIEITCEERISRVLANNRGEPWQVYAVSATVIEGEEAGKVLKEQIVLSVHHALRLSAPWMRKLEQKGALH